VTSFCCTLAVSMVPTITFADEVILHRVDGSDLVVG